MIMDIMFLLLVVMTILRMLRIMLMIPTWRGMVAWSGVRKEFQ